MDKQILINRWVSEFFTCHIKKISGIILFVFLSSYCQLALSETADDICRNPIHEVDKMVCGLSSKFNISPLKVGTGMVVASLEMTGAYCDFNFSDSFLEYRIVQENDPQIRKVIEALIYFYHDKPPPGFNGDKKVFCKMQRSQFPKIFK